MQKIVANKAATMGLPLPSESFPDGDTIHSSPGQSGSSLGNFGLFDTGDSESLLGLDSERRTGTLGVTVAGMYGQQVMAQSAVGNGPAGGGSSGGGGVSGVGRGRNRNISSMSALGAITTPAEESAPPASDYPELAANAHQHGTLSSNFGNIASFAPGLDENASRVAPEIELKRVMQSHMHMHRQMLMRQQDQLQQHNALDLPGGSGPSKSASAPGQVDGGSLESPPFTSTAVADLTHFGATQQESSSGVNDAGLPPSRIGGGMLPEQFDWHNDILDEQLFNFLIEG